RLFHLDRLHRDPAGQGAASVTVQGGGGALGELSLDAPGVRLPLAAGMQASDVALSVELPEVYTLGGRLEGWAVYTVPGSGVQEAASVRVPLQARGLDALLESSRGQIHPAAADVEPAGYLHLILGVSAAAVVLAGAGALWYGRRRGPAARAGRAGPDGPDGIQNGI